MSVRVDQPAPHVRRIVIDRPPVNALDTHGMEALGRVLDELDRDRDVRCAILAGAGGTFTAGGDLREQQAIELAERERYIRGFLGLVDRIEALRVPVVAAVEGPCFGGGLELALACDVRIAAADATFCASGVNVGLIVSFQRLPRAIGLGPAMEMLLTGGTYDAEQAERWGLVTALHPPERFADAVAGLAERIASRAPLSVEASKALALQAFDLTPAQARETQIARFLDLSATRDHVEALDAFAAKQTPTFQRR